MMKQNRKEVTLFERSDANNANTSAGRSLGTPHIGQEKSILAESYNQAAPIKVMNAQAVTLDGQTSFSLASRKSKMNTDLDVESTP